MTDEEKPVLSYATPDKQRRGLGANEAIVVVMALAAFSGVLIVFIAGMTWPTAATIIGLSAAAVALGWLISRR